jgi:hypothetical protein
MAGRLHPEFNCTRSTRKMSRQALRSVRLIRAQVGANIIDPNAALAMVEVAAPRDELEGALAVQMACTHAAAMSVLARLGGGHGTERR